MWLCQIARNRYLALCRERKRFADRKTEPEGKKKTADDAAAVKKIPREWKKGKRKARLKGAAVAVLVCAVLFGVWYGLTQWYIRDVPIEQIEATNVRQLSDGRILFHMFADDGYELREVRYIDGQEGDRFAVPRRPVLCAKRQGAEVTSGIRIISWI